MDSKRRQPGFVVVLLALLGFFSLPHVMKLQDGGTPSNPQDKTQTTARAVHDEEEDEHDDFQDLRPLLDYLSDGKARQPKRYDLKATIRAKLPNVKCLVITLRESRKKPSSAACTSSTRIFTTI